MYIYMYIYTYNYPNVFQTGFEAHQASYPMGYGGSFPRGNVAMVWIWPLTTK
jgi:hypothetical protein